MAILGSKEMKAIKQCYQNSSFEPSVLTQQDADVWHDLASKEFTLQKQLHPLLEISDHNCFEFYSLNQEHIKSQVKRLAIHDKIDHYVLSVWYKTYFVGTNYFRISPWLQTKYTKLENNEGNNQSPERLSNFPFIDFHN